MCPCDLSRYHSRYYVCPAHEDEIRDLYAALAACERDGDDRQRQIRGELRDHGLAAEIVKHKLDTEAYERAEATR